MKIASHMGRAARYLRRASITALAGLVLGAVVAAPAHAEADGPVGPQVVGGDVAQLGEFPWMVRLSMGCGGSMYTPTLILTAAHCVADLGTGPTTSVTATWGTVDLEDPGATTRTSDYIYVADGYWGHGRDWALIRLSEPIDSPLLRLATDTSLQNGSFTVAGWGATYEDGPQHRFQLKADVPFISDTQCATAVGYASLVPDEEICAGDWLNGGVDTCQGDSGGPMVKRDAAGEWVQVGITSWGKGCAEPQKPGVYTEVRTFADDICAAAASLGGCQGDRGLAVGYPGRQVGTVGTAVSPVSHTASGGTAPYSWSATGLPPGLSIDPSTGSVAGTPTTGGTYRVTVTATDASSPARTGITFYSWTIALAVRNPGSQTSAAGTPIAPVGHAASGGTAPYSWYTTGLPAGLSISPSTGSITGTPTAAGTYSVTVTATDGSSPAATGSTSYTWTVLGGLTVGNPGNQTSAFGTPITPVGHTASGGVAPYAWSASGLPPGLSIDPSTGSVSGAPTVAGTYSVIVTATDSTTPTRTGRALYSWTVSPAPVPGCSGAVGTDVPIPDASTVDSAIAIAGCAGKASSAATVQVHILHGSVSELVVTLVAPDGSSYVLHNRELGSTGGIHQTYVVNLSSEVAEGTWKLRVQDLYAGYTGTIDSWALNVSGGTTDCTGASGTDVPIPDVATINSAVALSGGCSGYASKTSQVKVDIVHPYSGDLVVTLVAPDGDTRVLRNKTGGANADIHETYTLDLSAEPRTGTWKLRVQDVGFGYTGYLDAWKLNLGNGG